MTYLGFSFHTLVLFYLWPKKVFCCFSWFALISAWEFVRCVCLHAVVEKQEEPEEHGLVAHKPPEDNEHSYPPHLWGRAHTEGCVFFILHCRSHVPHMFMLKKKRDNMVSLTLLILIQVLQTVSLTLNCCCLCVLCKLCIICLKIIYQTYII